MKLTHKNPLIQPKDIALVFAKHVWTIFGFIFFVSFFIMSLTNSVETPDELFKLFKNTSVATGSAIITATIITTLARLISRIKGSSKNDK